MSIPLLVLQWTATMEEHPSEEVSAVEEDETWMTPLIRYLEADTLPGYCSEARKIKNQGARYCISQEKLYRSKSYARLTEEWSVCVARGSCREEEDTSIALCTSIDGDPRSWTLYIL
ncbi:hypothetical protein F2Q68_00016997 [Brassica cretica]|uniref:Uncharacterized protein n=1 Tax=Brassica cretica TaxID=69181 RepID=A0A8S9HPV4_BRACR|nr:hypothetical protein F2Q68_00016997 [Brassica cretica]